MTPSISKRLFLLLILFVFSLPAIAADSLPTTQDINDAARKAKQITDDFFTRTVDIRMQYEYAGRFLNPQDKDSLYKAAQRASTELEQIANDQNNLKKHIEDYQGNDWETRFGQTGLWRKLAADLQKTKSSKLEIDGYFAITDAAEADCPPSAIHCYCTAIKASMEKIRCFGPSGPNELNDITLSLAKSECSNDSEMLFLLALLQRRFAPADLQNTLSRSPQLATQFGKLILADMSAKFASPDANLASFNPIDARLAAAAILQTDTRQHADLVTALADCDKFQAPAVFYAAATLYKQTSPKKAVDLLIKASIIQSEKRDDLLDVTAEEMARNAFEIAYQEFQKDPNDCQQAVNAYQNYSRVAPTSIDEQTHYLYAVLLGNCARQNEAAEEFRAIAQSSQSFWSDAATLELLKIELYKAVEPNGVLDNLRDFILRCTRPEERAAQLRLEAINLYCETLLGRDDSNAAQKVLYILDNAPTTPGVQYDFFRARALRQLGQLEESTRFMSKAINDNDNSIAPQAVLLTSEILDKIELWQQNARDFNEMLQNCAHLAQFAHKSLNNRQTALIWAELLTFVKIREQTPLYIIDQNDVISMRVKARFLMAQGDFNQAAQLWAKITELRRNETQVQNQKSYGWWQAKFYELDCLAKLPDADKRSINHTIEVLQNSYTDIPAPWPEKLNLLRE